MKYCFSLVLIMLRKLETNIKKKNNYDFLNRGTVI